jgi:hypothetical protein
LGAAGSTVTDDPLQKEITIAGVPHTKCMLHPDGSDASMPVWADDEGIIHLSAAPTVASQMFAVECSEPNGSAQYKFDLANPDTFSPATPRAVSKDRSMRPALQDIDMKQEGLIAAGYPPRPDKGSSRYARWLENVSRPAIVIKPHQIESQLSFDPGTSKTGYNWVGFSDRLSERQIY